MRNAKEQAWKEQEGKLMHIRKTSVYPWNDRTIKVAGTILELEEYFEFEVDVEE